MKLEKRIYGILFLSVLFVSLFGGIGVVSGEEEGSKPLRDSSGNIENFLSGDDPTFFQAWDFLPSFIAGNDFFKQWSVQGKEGVNTAFIKILVLLLVIVLFYSIFSYVNFPESRVLQFIIALVLGVLSTLLISSEELYAALISYQALGISITLFFPIFVLSLYTFVVATRNNNGIGLLTQQILWIIFGAYLFLRSAVIVFLKWAVASKGEIVEGGFLHTSVKFLGVDAINITQLDSTLMVLHLVVALAVLFIFVLGNRKVVGFLVSSQMNWDDANLDNTLERASNVARNLSNFGK